VRDGHRLLQLSYFDDEIDDILMLDESGGKSPIRLNDAIFYSKNGESLPESSSSIQEVGGDFAWTFDLDFHPDREALREQFPKWIGFESSGIPLDVSPISFDGLEEFGKFIGDHGADTVIYTAQK
jgi:hypothetical protein